MKNISRRYIGGFTLIELLVVVLIIGILSAVAIPMYQKAVWSARAAILKMTVKNLADAQERFYLENGYYALSFSELDISMDSLEPKKYTGVVWAMVYAVAIPSGGDSLYGNDWFSVGIGTRDGTYRNSMVWSGGWFTKGPYAISHRGTGFAYIHEDYRRGSLPDKTMYCMEDPWKKLNGKFCEKVLHGSPTGAFDNAIYTLP